MDAGRMTAEELANACARVMWDDDQASQRLGMTIDHIAPGAATLSMTITPEMTNGHGTCHGGYIFTLADSLSPSPATAITSAPSPSTAR